MTENGLRGQHILVVEDEYFLADELETVLVEDGAIVVGPVGTVKDALAAIAETHIDGAILDVNLRGEMAFPVADTLVARGVPFVFTTGYDGGIIPDRLASITRCEKPIKVRRVAQALCGSIQG